MKPKQPYADWVYSIDAGTSPDDPVGVLDTVGAVYLFDGMSGCTGAEAEGIFAKYWQTVARLEFSGWESDDGLWPKLSSLAEFEEFFEWHYLRPVYDLGKSELSRNRIVD